MQLITNCDAWPTAWSKQDTWLHAVHCITLPIRNAGDETWLKNKNKKNKKVKKNLKTEDDGSGTDEEQRMLHVVQQFVSTLEMQNNKPL